MDRMDILDEHREALLDKLYLIYIRCISAVGRKVNHGHFFNIQDRNECDMETAMV